MIMGDIVMQMPALIPVIIVEDIRKAINFYSKLGFIEEKEYTCNKLLALQQGGI
jgi:predicted lactoylglutathione lyase